MRVCFMARSREYLSELKRAWSSPALSNGLLYAFDGFVYLTFTILAREAFPSRALMK